MKLNKKIPHKQVKRLIKTKRVSKKRTKKYPRRSYIYSKKKCICKTVYNLFRGSPHPDHAS